MSPRRGQTFEDVRRIALALPGVEDGVSYGAPALKVNGNLLIRLRDDLGAIVVKTTFAERDELVEEDPEAYFLTEHYVPYEWMLVRLSTVRLAQLRAVVERGWALAAAEKPKRARTSR